MQVRSKITKQNSASYVEIKIPRTWISTKPTAKTPHSQLQLSANLLRVVVKVSHDNFLVDFMLEAIREHNIPLSTWHTNMTKEISESGAGIYYATVFDVPTDCTCFIIGEGSRPQISLVLSKLRPTWNIISIDPIIECEDHDRVEYIRGFDYEYDIKNPCSNIVIIGIHSHGDMAQFYRRICENCPQARKLLVFVPCCFSVGSIQPDFDFECPGIFSAKNRTIICTDFDANDGIKTQIDRWKNITM